MTEPRNLLHRLLEYIEEQAKDIDPRGFRISTHKGFLRLSGDLRGLPGIVFDQKVEGDHIWLMVPRLQADRAPTLPLTIKDVVKLVDHPDNRPPVIDESLFAGVLAKQSERLVDAEKSAFKAKLRADFERELEVYLAGWNAWAELERPRRRTITLYSDLFALKHQLEAEETTNPQELVWGIGITFWKLPYDGGHTEFEYPVLTQSMEIVLDENSMALELRPRAVETRVELDALVACQITGAADVERTGRDQLARAKDRPVTPFDPGSYADVLKLIASNLDSNGRYIEILTKEEPLPAPTDSLTVTDCWILMARPRSKNYFFEDLKRLKEDLRSGCDIPPGPRSIVTPPSNQPVQYEPVRFRGISSRGASGGGSDAAQELFFPLPYNDEQVTIVHRLDRAAGTTVQGPPGTGKTHTIANIICHYLATGRRVLVTSRGEPALQVLQSKIPEEVRPLTVALLAGDREAVRQFQASIDAIQHRVSQLNPEQTKNEIQTLTEAIDRAHAALTVLDKRVDEIASSQLATVKVDGVELRAQQLAEMVIAAGDRFAWLDDVLSLEQKHSPPLSTEESAALREARRKLGRDIVYLHHHVPAADDLPTIDAVASLHKALSQIRTIESQVQTGKVLPLVADTPEVLKAAVELLALVEQARRLAQDLESHGEDWPIRLREQCRQASQERQALEVLLNEVQLLINARGVFLKRPVELPDEALGDQKTMEAIQRGAQTGKPFSALNFGNAQSKKHLRMVRIAGLAPVSSDDWVHVYSYLELHTQVHSFEVRWNQFATTLSVPKLSGGVAKLRQIELVASAARNAHRLAMSYDCVLPRKAETIFTSVPSRELQGNSAELDKVRLHLLTHLSRANLAKAAVDLNTLRSKLAGQTGSISHALKTFVDKHLGDTNTAVEKISARYSELLAELRRIAALAVEFATVRDAASRIETAGAHKLATRLRTIPVEMTGEDPVFPTSWRDAWNWARIRSHLAIIEAREELIALSAKRRDLEAGLARLYKEMVAKAAWLATKSNASPRVLQALAGYAVAIRRIGQGTGPNATRYRRDARESMLDAASAVPCWIMSHARISEAMPANIGSFDLVIVDEASQSDLWALPAILRGKKILVVGDDKQVSPDSGFIASQKIQTLRDRFLVDQPYGAEMTPEKSLYDLAARVFAAEQVMLREHFRCVPPIIAYSNRVFYKGGIQPLRIPKASERIDPPLVDIYVPDGIRDKRDRNDLEARAIAEEIASLLANEEMKSRTIGVVSLLGIEQAKHIDSLVRARCDASALHHRKFECGDARTFQGSERDIMFISLVADARQHKALTGTGFEQRFNVAASRARDRMYLVRSVQASELSDVDLRLGLLRHFEKPLVTEKDEALQLIDRCESGFERDVYSALVRSGYRVIPQVKTGAYRIDMVVEGEGDRRLAIECDGDAFHGPDRWQQDMNRQRILERAGWIFWRCFASTWTMHKDDVLAELLERLQAMGIEPLGALERAPDLVDRRVWRPDKGQAADEIDPITASLTEIDDLLT